MALFYVQGVPIGYIAIMLALVASVGGFIFGYDTGQISDILVMDDFVLRFAQTADFLGRRYAMMAESLVFMVGVIIQISTSQSWVQFAIGRLISGFGVGGLSAAVPMYQAECAPPQIRGTLTATYQLFITLGILVAYAISIGTRSIEGAGSWRTVVGISFVWPAILIVGMLFMPESPRWLARQGRHHHAREALARVRGVPAHQAHEHSVVVREAEEIRQQVEYEKNIQAGWLDCFRPGHKTLYRTLLGMVLQSLQQLTGANYFFYYGATVFKAVGISDSYITQLILGAVNFGCTFCGMYVLQRFGRRLPLLIGGAWQACWLLVFASAGTAKDPETDKEIGTLMIVSACLFIFGYATTWAPGIWIVIGETFPTRTRAKQIALATASNWVWNFLLAFFTPFIDGAIHYRYGFVFAGCNVLCVLAVFFFLYESSGLSLEGVDQMYNDPACKPWTSRKWAPLGYTSRQDLADQTRAAEAHKPLDSGSLEETRREKAVTEHQENAPAV